MEADQCVGKLQYRMNVYLGVILIGLGIVSLGFTCIQLWFYWIIKNG